MRYESGGALFRNSIGGGQLMRYDVLQYRVTYLSPADTCYECGRTAYGMYRGGQEANGWCWHHFRFSI